ncbi:hypothetical protein NliqN6_1066 [Naganishia liquefaciens]|uniref:Uncharacterized protein n=1 Tax=Naganishia liquefaciens TaxID=104408 RepID=A0A8H3TQX8_9TREE|nr:hypothetical protein NliqN6_1066 [Naganishia liquefaciens]
MNPLDTPASEWSHQTLAALEGKQAQESALSGREQAAAILAQKQQQSAHAPPTVDQQLAQSSAPVIPTREPVVEAIPAVAVIEQPVPSLHTTAHGVPHVPEGMPISATAQTGGFAEPRLSEVKAVPAAIVGDTAVVAVPPVEEMTTTVPGKELKTVPDLSAKPEETIRRDLPLDNVSKPTHTPGFLDSGNRTLTGVTTPGMELPGGWGAVLKSQGAAAKPDTETSLSEDVTTALHEVGRTAFSVLPKSLVDKVSNHPSETTGTTGTALPSAQEVRETAGNVATTVGTTASNVGSQVYATTANIGSAIGGTTSQAATSAGETATQAGQTVRETTGHAAETLVQTGQGLVDQARHALENLHLPGFGTPVGQQTSTSATTTSRGVSGTQQDSAVDQAKHIAQELLGTTQSKAEQAYNAVRGDTSGTTGAAGTGQAKSWRGTLEEYTERAATQVAEFGGHSVNPNVHDRAATSLPSQETTGAHPGEQSGGVGALPGSKFAEGVAILPEERAIDGGNTAQSYEGRGAAQIKTLSSTHEPSANTSNQTKHEGYAPAGPAMGSSSTPAYQQEAGHSHHGHGQETYEAPHRSLTEIIKDGANKHEHKAGYAPAGPAADLSGAHTRSSGGAPVSTTTNDKVVPSGSYELGSLSGEPKSSERNAAPGPAAGLDQPTTEDSTIRDVGTGTTKTSSSEHGGLSGALTQAVRGVSGATTTTTFAHAPSAGSGPNYDLAPPLGAIVGATPLSSHVQTDRSDNPVLPGNIPAAVTREPVAVAAPSESTAIAAEQSQGPSSRGSTYNSKDSDVVSPGSTLESEPTQGSAVNPALARVQAPKPDRVDSTASTTAIIHGKPGNPHHEKQPSARSSLAAVSEKALPHTPQTGDHQSTPTSHSTAANTATRAPGTETGAVGGKDMTTANSEPHKNVKEEFAAVGHGTLDKPASSAAAKEAPVTESSAIPGQGRTTGAAAATTAPTAEYVPSQHARTGSAGSSASKRSFLDKLKDKIHHKKH